MLVDRYFMDVYGVVSPVLGHKSFGDDGVALRGPMLPLDAIVSPLFCLLLVCFSVICFLLLTNKGTIQEFIARKDKGGQ